MKRQLVIMMLLLVALTSRAYVTNASFTVTPSTIVPDGNPVGIVSPLTVSGMSGHISSLTVTLNITGGYNGDLYAYLFSPQFNTVVLLNRVGMGSANSFGYSDSGVNITLDSSVASSAANNVHFYQNTAGAGPLTGAWAPDGRTVDPVYYSSPADFNAIPPINALTSLEGFDPNGVWKLFIADVNENSDGEQSTLVSWGLTVVTVPEPQTWAMLVGGLSTFWLTARRRRN